jgi:ABC-type polysaccharide/polyol phosphate transport system ATPase subunit
MGEARVEFRNVRKAFRRRNRSAALRDAIPRVLGIFVGRRPPPQEPFVALDDVSFAVAPGEVLGIVGPNGAGKSTSLRLAAGIMRADSGTVRVDGRVAALIELSAGFHPDLSGRENVYLAGALVGLRRSEVRAVFDRIVEFSGIGEFLDSPARTYSSGMAMRLGFAVAAHVPAEVMLVDEVLAVGDIEFQSRCIRRMSERRKEGVSILFVSHHMPTVQEFCDRVLFVSHGRIQAEGPPREVIAAYRASVARQAEGAGASARSGGGSGPGAGGFVLGKVDLAGDDGLEPNTVRHRGRLRISADWTASRPVPRPVLGVVIHAAEGQVCAELKSTAAVGVPEILEGRGTLEVDCEDVALLPGEYEVTVYARDQAGWAMLDQHQRLYSFRVLGEATGAEGGVVALRPTWRIRQGGRG